MNTQLQTALNHHLQKLAADTDAASQQAAGAQELLNRVDSRTNTVRRLTTLSLLAGIPGAAINGGLLGAGTGAGIGALANGKDRAGGAGRGAIVGGTTGAGMGVGAGLGATVGGLLAGEVGGMHDPAAGVLGTGLGAVAGGGLGAAAGGVGGYLLGRHLTKQQPKEASKQLDCAAYLDGYTWKQN